MWIDGKKHFAAANLISSIINRRNLRNGFWRVHHAFSLTQSNYKLLDSQSVTLHAADAVISVPINCNPRRLHRLMFQCSPFNPTFACVNDEP